MRAARTWAGAGRLAPWRLMLKRQFVIPALVVAVVVLVLVAALRGRGGADAGASGETASVERRTFVATVLAVGAVRARIGAEVRVGSRISGRVQRLRANIGDVVQKGQVIAELETAEADATVAERRAEVELADAKLAARDTLSPEGLARARAEVARAEATEKLTAAEWDRQQQLLKDRVTTVADAEAARERHLVAQAQLASARRD
ncbi:MAG TPA: biotin/lipoyl-binding protein, partial [Gemmatimonadaceae bacterium]